MIAQKSLLLYTAILLMATTHSAFHSCSSGVSNVMEGTDVSFTCGPYNYQVEWYSSSDYVEWNYIGYCERIKCYSKKSSLFPLNAKTIPRGGYQSTLDIKRVTRQQDTYLSCRYEDKSEVCELRIVVPSTAKNCDVSISNWRVYGSCALEKIFASDGKYSCMWSVNNEKLTSYESLSQYWTGGKNYQKGFCNFTQTMPVQYMTYTYKVSIDPGPSNFVVETITIVPPGYPFHTCRDIVEEGSSFICTCTSSKKGFPLAVVIWDTLNTDILQIKNVQREQSGLQYTCRLTWGPNSLISHTADYTLKVLVPVSIVPNTCSVQLLAWKVSGVCTVQRLRKLKSTMCKWILKNKKNTKELHGYQSVVSYTSTDTGDYTQEHCSFLEKMPVDDGNYTYSYSVSSHPDDQCSKTIYIERPNVPQHNCSKMILEGSNMTCTCFTPNLGNPPAQVGWEGSGKKYLAITGRKQKQGMVVTCSLTWGVFNYTTPYVVNIAYGPSQTYINSSEESSGDETRTRLICTAIDVYPAAVFHWNISCDKETHGVNTSTCTVSTTRVEDITAVECMASNQIFVEVFSTSIYVFKLKHNSFKTWILAGGVAVMIILTILVAVLVVFIKRRIANKTKPHIVHFATPSRDVDPTLLDNILETQTPVARISAPSGDLYTLVGQATARVNEEVNKQEAAKNRTCATQRKSGHQASNTVAQTHEGTERKSLAKMHKPTKLDKKQLQDQSVTGYMNIPKVPMISGLGVYHNALPAATSEARISDVNDGTDEYNVLRLREHRTGQEDHSTTYSHLDFK